MASRIRRRAFLQRSAGIGAGVMLASSRRAALGYQANERLNLALVGLRGYGVYFGFVCGIHMHENVAITAMCDVDLRKVKSALAAWDERARDWPGSEHAHLRDAAPQYIRLAKNHPPLLRDYRVMLDKMDREIDAVAVATPDHTHAIIAGAALSAGKHAFAEKPLTISAHEARALRRLAAGSKLATQVNTHGASQPGFLRGMELLHEGAIGDVKEVHLYFTRGGRGFNSTPQGSEPVPPELAWDLWLGPLAWREYHPGWINRIAWRGTSIGELGNHGPHVSNLACKALNVGALWERPAAQSAAAPIRVSAECSEVNRISYPRWERIRWELPARPATNDGGSTPAPAAGPVTITWHHGWPPGYAPGSHEMLVELMANHGVSDADIEETLGGRGCIFVGTKGLMFSSGANTSVTLLPRDRYSDVQQNLPERHPRLVGHYQQWTNACRGGRTTISNFEHATAQAELLNLGEVATRYGGDTLEYDPVAGRIANHAAANGALEYPYRDGWTL